MDETAQTPDSQSAPQEAAPALPIVKQNEPAIGLDKPQSEQAEPRTEPPPSPEQSLERRFSVFERWMIGLTIFGVVVAAITGWIFWGQLGVMSKQLDSMNDAGKQTDRIIAANERLAKAAETGNSQGKSALDTTIAENRKAVASTLAQAKSALDASIEASRLDERPWLRLVQIELSAEPAKGKAIAVAYRITNSGKTPAFQETVQERLFIWQGMPPTEHFPDPKGAASVSYVAPGETRLRSSTPFWTPEDKLIDMYSSRTASLYLQALIRYKDAFNRPHWTRVCEFHAPWMGALDSFAVCPNGEDMDHEGNYKEPN